MTKKAEYPPCVARGEVREDAVGSLGGYLGAFVARNLGKKGWERVPQAKKPSRVRAMSSRVEGFRTVLGEFVTAEAKNGAVKAVFALIYVESAVYGVLSTLV